MNLIDRLKQKGVITENDNIEKDKEKVNLKQTINNSLPTRENLEVQRKESRDDFFLPLNQGKQLKYINTTNNMPSKENISNILKGAIKTQTKGVLPYIWNNYKQGLVEGTAGIAQGQILNASNEAKKISEKDNKNKLKDLNDTLLQTLNPIYGMTKKSYEIGQNTLNTLKDKDKTVKQKVAEILTNSVSGVKDLNNPIGNIVKQTGKTAGIIDKNAGNKLSELNEKIDKPIRNNREKLQQEGQNYSNVARMAGTVSNVVGNMTPSIIASRFGGGNEGLTQALSLGTMGLSAKGRATQEALNKGAELDKAIKIGDTKAMTEVGTELLTGGLNIFGKGALDNIVERGINKKVTNNVLNYLAKQGAGIVGEIGEETISDILNTVIDQGTVDPKATYSMKDWSDTALTTMLSTVVLNALGGAYTPKAYNQNVQKMEQINAKQDITERINNSNLSETDKSNMINYVQNEDFTQADYNAMRETIENSKQPTNTISQEQINSLVERIDNSNLPNEDKLMMKDYIQNNNVSESDIESMNNVIDSSVVLPANNELITNQNFKDNVEARRKYAKYKNDTGEYNSKAINEVLDIIPENRNGNRTVKQWLQVAKETGTRIADLSNEEIERIAYKSWFDVQPSKNITKYDRQTKSTVGFQKLTSDEWVNEINKAVNEARANNQVQNENSNKSSFSYDEINSKISQETNKNKLTENGITMTYVHMNNQDTQKYGSLYGQNIEPSGEYMNVDTMEGKYKVPGADYGIIHFDNPLILDHINTGETGWKKTLSDMFNNKTGKELSDAVKKAGYDGIITIDEDGYYNEVVNLDGRKNNNTLENRVSGDTLLNAQDLIDELKEVGAKVDDNGYVTVYHQTTKENADNIIKTGKMSAKEDGIFFSTSKNATQADGRGDTKIEFKIPVEDLVLDDIFDDNADVRIPLKNSKETIDVSKYLTNEVTNNQENNKQKQLDIIQKNNPMTDDYHTGIRSIEDIKTFDEVINDEESFVYGDFSKEDAEKALKEGKVTVYSSNPIKQGSFVSTSQNMAKDYAGNGKIYSQEVNLKDVAWINGDEGQYARLENNQETLYNNIKIGETKNIDIDDISDLIGQGGYRTEEQINKLRESIKKNGITTPIEIYRKNDGTIEIENGNHRLQIAKELGIRNVPVKMVESWENIGISENPEKSNVSERVEREYEGNIRNNEQNNNIDEKGWFVEGRSQSNSNELRNRGTRTENAEISNGQSIRSDKQESNSLLEKNNEQIKNSNQSSFNMPTAENNAQNTKGESINWNEIERPEGKFRKHYQSIIQSSNTTAQAKAVAKEMMGLDTYVPQSNTELLQKADNRISATNAVNELNSLYSRVMNNEKVNDVDIAVGERLIEYFSKTGDAENLQTAIHTTAMAGTQAGRVVQAMALLNHMTPRGQVVWLQRSIDKMNNELQQKYKNKKDIPQFELTSEMTEKILNTENQEKMFDVLDDIYEELGQQVPKSFSEKIDEWRYFSMLANVKTHARNMIGNVAMGATQRIKNKVAGAIEGTVAKFNPEMERTHSIRKASKEVKEFAKNDVKNMDVQTELGMNENKYNPQSRLQNSRRTFKNETLEKTVGKLFDLNSTALEVEDNIGLKSMYISALSDYLTANKIDVKNMTDAQLAKARQHAIKEAQEATFHQASAIATALTQMGNKNKYAKFFLDAAVPFKKTPVNVAKTGIQYSPVGLMKSAIFDVSKVRKGTITVNQYIDNVSKGLTGTGITFLGYALAQAGILKASGEDDEKKENYDKEQGRQSYSIEIGGKTASLDWLSPVGIPLFIGAEINQQFNSSKKEKNGKSNDDGKALEQIIQRVSNIANASANAMNPMSEMSMISGLTSVLSSYNKENAVGDMIVNTGKSYVNQFLPTAVKQLARTTDEYERTTKSTKTGALPRAIDSTINQIKSGLPGIRKTLPVKTDIWGQEVKQQENLPFRAFNNFINPAVVKDVSINEVDKELNSLYSKTKESSIIPKSIEKTVTFDGTNYRMTNEEYAKYNKKYGETSYSLIKGLVTSNNYKDLTDEQKQKAIESVYSYAKEQNKVDYAKENNIKVKQSSLYDTMKALETGRGNQSYYLEYISKTTGSDIKEKDKINELYNAKYDKTTKDIIYSNTIGKKDDTYKILSKDNINVNEYLNYKAQNFESDKEDNGTTKGKSQKNKKDKVVKYLNSMDITGNQRLLLYASQGYSTSASQKKELVNYISDLDMKLQDKLELFSKFSGFEVYKNGQIKY